MSEQSATTTALPDDLSAVLDERAALADAGPDLVEALRVAWPTATHWLTPPGLTRWLDGIEAMLALGRGNGPALAYIDTMPELGWQVGEDILDATVAAAMKLGSLTSGDTIRDVIESLPVAARHLGDASLMDAWLLFLHQFASTSARALRPMLSQLDVLFDKLTLSGLRRWAAFGTENYRRDFANLQAYFRLETADARAVLERERRGVLFTPVQRRLTLYLRALWGRDFALRPLGGEQDTVRPCIEDNALHLPDAVDAIGATSGLDVYRAIAAHLAAHLMYGGGAVDLSPFNPAQRFLVGFMEDARIESLAAAEFPGVGRLWRSLLSGVQDAAVEHETLTLLTQLALWVHDPDTALEDPEIWSFARRWQRDLRRLVQSHRSGDTPAGGTALSVDYALALYALLASRHAVPSLRILESLPIPYRDDNRIVEAGAALDIDVEGGTGAQSQIQRRVNVMEFVNEVDCELAGDDAQEIWTCRSELFPYEDDLETTESYNARWGREPAPLPVHYPEWDRRVQLHRPDWVTLFEQRPVPGDAADIDALLDANRGISHRIRQIIDRLAPVGVQRLRRQVDGPEIDLDAAVNAMIDLRRRVTPSSRITMRNVIQHRDIAVVVLLDLSESTNDPMPGGERTILDLTREAAALVATAIDGIGDRFAIDGFASDGRHNVRYFRFKDFTERFDETARARLAGMTGGLSTRMGAALRHAGQRLLGLSEKRKLVLLVTDGEPADIDESDPTHLREDARKAVEELHGAGITTWCLTLDPRADRYVSQIFGHNRYTIIDRVERLPETLPQLFASLTRPV